MSGITTALRVGLVTSLRVGLALLLSLLVVVESAGVARAMGVGATVSCCCGRHAVARPCSCLSCPSKLRRAVTPRHDHASAAVAAPGSCTPANEADALVVVATLVVVPSVAPPRFIVELAPTAPVEPQSFAPEPARPPP